MQNAQSARNKLDKKSKILPDYFRNEIRKKFNITRSTAFLLNKMYIDISSYNYGRITSLTESYLDNIFNAKY